MEKEQLLNVGYDMIYLASCALHTQIPSQEMIERMDLSAVYKLAKNHSMQAITSVAIDSFVKANPDFSFGVSDELIKKWIEELPRSIRKTIMVDAERENILSKLEESGIWYLPLKGIVMQTYYPKLGMRQMADNDILFDVKYRKKLRNIMKDSGYDVKSYNKGAHDIYIKVPFMNFEMHAYLYRESLNKVWANYYKNIKTRLIKDEENRYGYHFSNEDFYVYITTHAYKHFSHGGNGVRSLMDIYAFISKMADELNKDYVESQLKYLEIDKYEKATRRLADKLFSQECNNLKSKEDILTDSEREMLAFFISSGTYGRFDVAINSKIDKNIEGGGSKLKYYLRRLFPDMTYYQENYPVVYKYKILIPFFLIYRAMRAIIKHPGNIIGELKILLNRKK